MSGKSVIFGTAGNATSASSLRLVPCRHQINERYQDRRRYFSVAAGCIAALGSAPVGWPSPFEPPSPNFSLFCGDGTKCPLARYGATDPYCRDQTSGFHICRRRSCTNLSQRSSHNEVHLRTTELRLARMSRRTQRDQTMNTSRWLLCGELFDRQISSAHYGSSTKRHQNPLTAGLTNAWPNSGQI